MLLADALEEQRRFWRAGERVLVETLLKKRPLLNSNREHVLDLIYNEMMLREEAGEKPALADYLHRFPNLGEELTLQFELERGLDWNLMGDEAPPAEPPPPDSVAQAPHPDLPGYAIESLYLCDAGGVTYHARHLEYDRPMLVKFALTGDASPSDFARFRSDAEMLRGMRHPHILEIFDVGVHAGRPYLAFERIERSLTSRQESITPHLAAQSVESLARTMHALHQKGIVHQSLVSANVFVAPDGRLLIGGFTLTLGRGVDAGFDLRGLGGILYEMLQRSAPRRPESRASWQVAAANDAPAPADTRDLEAIAHACTAGDTYASAEELADDLNAFRAGKSIRAGRSSLPLPSRATWGYLTGTALSLGALGAGALWSEALAAAGVAGLALTALTWWMRRRHERALERAARDQARGLADLARTELILGATRRLTCASSLTELERLLVETACWLTGAEIGMLYLVHRDTNDLSARVLGKTGIEERRLKLGHGVAGTVAKKGHAIHLPDVAAESRFFPRTAANTPPRNLVAVPMVGDDGAVLAVLQLANKKEGAFLPQDVELLSEILASAASVVRRLR